MVRETLLDAYAAARQQMVESQLRARGIQDERVLAAMSRVPRHEFISPEYHSQAYDDHPLPIGEGQTISQPYIVARMLEALALQPSDRVLEVGAGSGYMTVLLALLAGQVYAVERHPELVATAAKGLAACPNVVLSWGDGSLGLPASAPFDAIVVSAAAPSVPQALFDQLREGGRMVVPVGSTDSQELQLIRKIDGLATVRVLDGCRFVPLIGSQGNPVSE